MANPIKFNQFVDADVQSGLDNLTKEFTEFGKTADRAVKNIGKEADKTKVKIDNLNKSISQAIKSIEKQDVNSDFGRDAIDKAVQSVAQFDKTSKNLQKTLKGQKASQDVLKGSVTAIKTEIKELNKLYQDQVNNQNKNEKSSQILARRISNLRQKQFELNRETSRLNKTFKSSDGSYNSLIKQNQRIREVLNRLPQEFIKTNRRARELQKTFAANTETLKRFDATLGQNFRNVGNYASAFHGLGGIIKNAFLPIGAAIVVSNALRNGLREAISVNTELSESFADVQKTTGLTSNEVERLNDALEGIDTRSSQQDLLGIATAAGRLDIAQKDIAGFTEEVDKAFVALGDDLGGNAEEIATQLGKINNLFGVEKEFGVAEGINKTGSAINELSANTKAAAPFLVDFTNRVGGIAPGANISVSKILGLAATFDELGQNVEVSATATGQFLAKLGTDVEGFSKIAGLGVEEFTRLLEEDANEAFLLVLEGAESTQGGLLGLAETFEKLGLDGARSRQTLGALAGNIDLVRKNQALANKEFDKATSLTAEFNIKNNTLAASFDKFNKQLERAFTSDQFSGFLQKAADAATGLLKAFNDFVEIPVSEKLQQEQLQLNSLVGAITNANNTQESRNRLINELQKQYPSFLDNLDAETVTNEQLRDRLKEVNEQLRNKIILQLQEEETSKLTERLVKLQLEEPAIIETIARVEKQRGKDSFSQLGVTVSNTQSLEQQEARLKANRDRQKEISDEIIRTSEKYSKLLPKTEEVAGSAIDTRNGLKEVNKELSSAEPKVTSLADEFQRLKDSLGIFDTQGIDNGGLFKILSGGGQSSVIDQGLEAEFFAKVKELNDKRVDNLKETLDRENALKELALQRDIERQQRRKQIEQEFFDFALGLGQLFADKAVSRLDEQQQNLETQKAKELELAEGNARAQAEIEQRFSRRQDQLRARRARAEILTQIPINAVQALSSPPAPNFVAAALSTAYGLAQLALIPGFFKGVKDLPSDTVAWVGEKGSEIVHDKQSGKSYLTPDRPTLTYLKKGTDVIPAHETERILNAGNGIQISDRAMSRAEAKAFNFVNDNSQLINESRLTRKELRNMASKIDSKPSLSPEWINGRVHAAINEKNNRKIYLSEKYS